MTRPERWRHLIQQAQSEAELVSLMREYIDTWMPSDIEKLPESCRDFSFSDADGVLTAAVHLTTCELKFDGDVESRELLQEAARTFVAASNRIGQLRPGPLSAFATAGAG